MGEFDVHYGAIGSGVDEGIIVKAIGTSTCDCTVIRADKEVADIPGICGIVKGAILPGYYGIEAGQSAVGDIFKWWVEVVCKGDADTHAAYTAEAEALAPGQSGLLALDWNNGNRTILVDQRLTGLLLGQTLHTSPAEIYRALIEATAFGARMIVERIAEYGVAVDRIVCCGGIAEKNPFLMQTYADITGREMQVAASSQACALGSAVAAAVLAGPDAGGHPDFPTAQAAMTGVKDTVYRPIPENHDVYSRLFALYASVHDAFGGVATTGLGHVMKELLAIKDEQRAR
jgi:L-ribulokinase